MLRRYLVAALPLLVAAQAPPPPPWAEARGDLDGDGKAERAHLERDGNLVVDGGDGRELFKLALPDAKRIERAEVRFVGVEERVVVVHARAQLGRGQATEAVVSASGKPIFLGRTGPRGDGDRIDRLRVDDGGVVRWQTAPGFRRCDGDDMLFPERWDFASGRFRGVTVEPPAAKSLRTTTAAPAGVSGPPLGQFHFVASSTDATGTRAADQLAAPRELEDAAPATVWHAGAGAAARGAWVTARTVGAGARIKAIQIVGGKEAPKSVVLVLGPSSDQHFSVDVGPGARWVALPSDAAATQCVSVVVAEPGARDNTLAEVAIYTDADGAGGIDRLVKTVAELGPDTDAAVHLLEARGLEAARAVAAALPASHGQGRRRLLQVLAAVGSEESAPALGKALETAEPEDRPTLVAALFKMGAAGVREAARVYGDGSQTAEARADAAVVLGMRSDDATAVDALLAGAGRGEAAVRLVTMKALAGVYARVPERVELALQKGGDDARVGDLARAISLVGARVRPEGAAALAGAWGRASSFELKLRLIRAMAAIRDRSLDGPLAAASRESDPVLRTAAVEAVAARAQAGTSGGDAVLRAALRDGDPGVRRAAVDGVATLKDGASIEAEVLAHDHWPLVRRAAADGIGGSCKGDAAARTALVRAVAGEGKSMAGADAAEEVRRAALASLGRCGDVPLATFAAVLTEKRQPVSVREQAAAFVAKHGGGEAARALAATLDDVLGDPNADERSAGLAVACTRALARTGDTSRAVLEALGQAANEPMSAPVRVAAMETIGKLCPDGAGSALRKGADDPDGAVKRAARSALERCKK